MNIEAILGRPEYDVDLVEPCVLLRERGARVFVTGAAGSIGTAFCGVLADHGVEHIATDLADADVTDAFVISQRVLLYKPSLIVHLAAAKSAPAGEADPEEPARVNVGGTLNVLAAARKVYADVVLASTCKACDPETAYGASKLLCERMVLCVGGSVARFYNIPESSGNVFRIWEAIPDDDPIPVTDCYRYFISLREAVGLLLWACVLDSGVYAVRSDRQRAMDDAAAALYPDRTLVRIPARDGDRYAEPVFAAAESQWEVRSPWLVEISRV